MSPRCPADASRTLAEFPEIDLQGKPLPEGACAEDVKVFQLLYREHCEVGGVPHPFPQIPAPPFLALGEPPDTLHCPPYTPPPHPTPPQAIVDVMINLQFTLVETLWKTFWRCSLSQPSEAAPVAV